MKLTENQLNNTIAEYISDNEWLNLTNSEVERIKKIYHSLENEKNLISKNLDETMSVVTGIANDVIMARQNSKISDNVMYDRFADNKHMNYFDIFLEDGARGDITETLKSYKIPTDILKPIRKMTDYSSMPEHVNGQLVQIVQETDKDDDGYVYVSNFKIIVDGEPIYQFSADKNFIYQKIKTNFKESAQSIYDESGEFDIGETIKTRKVNTPDYSYTEEAYANKDGEIKIRKRYSKGTIINGKNVGGRFMPL